MLLTNGGVNLSAAAGRRFAVVFEPERRPRTWNSQTALLNGGRPSCRTNHSATNLSAPGASLFGTWVTTDLNRLPPAKILSSTATFKIHRNPLKMQTIIFFANFAVNSRQSLHWNHLLEESALTRSSLALLPRRPKKEAGAG